MFKSSNRKAFVCAGAPEALRGREGRQEKSVLDGIRSVQTLARGMERQREHEQDMFQQPPSKLVVPSRDSPVSMFEPATWAMAFPDLFPWGDGVPFLRREVPLAAEEVFQYLLLREELEYEVDCADETPASRRRCSAASNADVRDIKASSRWTASVARHVLVSDRV